MSQQTEPKWREIQKESGIIGDSDAIRQLIETIDQVADTDISVLITGESGTGKELVAKAIHQNSRRRDKPFITVNCGAIPEGIIESELFGHEKGSFTGATNVRKGYFELADKGSIFLDEIGDLPIPTQVKLLRVLENLEFMRVGGTETIRVDVRFITATNKNLQKEVKKEHFREDLYFRLNAMHIHVPALRQRKEDIPLLVKKFAADFCRENHIDFKGFKEDALSLFRDYSWPGNIRELKNLVEKIIVLERGNEISESTLSRYLHSASEDNKNLPVLVDKPKEEIEREFLLRVLLEIKGEIAQLRDLLLSRERPPYRFNALPEITSTDYIEDIENSSREDSQEKSVSEMEKQLIQDTLAKTRGNKRQAAKLLGLSERTLYRKINRYGLR
jgi:DNA-binding NtrC family response regulator